MFWIRIMVSIMLASSYFAVTTVAYAADEDAKLRADLEHVAKLHVFFGHQSVGENILEGVEQLSKQAGIPVKIEKVKSASDIKQPMIGNAYIADNEYPYKKLKSFEQYIGVKQPRLDVALMKFCFVDIKADTDTKKLFASYQAAIEELKAKNPGVTFVHVTAPLTSEKTGLKEFVKRLIGRGGSAVNVRREEYNALLRKTYQGREPIFDLAGVESTTPDGSHVDVKWNNIVAPAMDPAYTDDGGHLNTIGKNRVAREFVSVLASIPVRPALSRTR